MIAIIGSGISGLTVAWSLNKKVPIRLFEKHPTIGMAAFTTILNLNGNAIPFDIPFRTIKPDYYPHLYQIFAKAKIETIPVDYSFRIESEGEPVFGFKSYSLLGKTFAFPDLESLLYPKGREILKDLLRFYSSSKSEWEKFPKPASVLEFLEANQYSSAFIHDFLLPSFSLVNTCKTETVANYPAESILSYHSPGFTYTPQRTAKYGTSDISQKLSKDVDDIHFGADIKTIKRTKEGLPRIDFKDGSSQVFEHIVFSTQANQARALLGEEFGEEIKALSYFQYEASDVLLHTEENFFPSRKTALLFRVKKTEDKPEVTLDLSRILPNLKGSQVFQTWNPHSFPEDSKILKRVSFERPVVNESTKQGINLLSEFHNDPNRRVWFCGSYSLHGIPLLEAGAKSALQVASKILKKEVKDLLI